MFYLHALTVLKTLFLGHITSQQRCVSGRTYTTKQKENQPASQSSMILSEDVNNDSKTSLEAQSRLSLFCQYCHLLNPTFSHTRAFQDSHPTYNLSHTPKELLNLLSSGVFTSYAYHPSWAQSYAILSMWESRYSSCSLFPLITLLHIRLSQYILL